MGQAAARFHVGNYLDGQYTVLGAGDHTFGNGVFRDGRGFGSLHLEPGTVVMIDGNDVEWCGGLDGRDWFHVGYISQFLGLACRDRKPVRVKVSYAEGPVLALYDARRYNGAHDVWTVRPPADTASGAHMMDGWLHDKVQGAIAERDMTAYLCRSSHGGPADPSPLEVVGPRDTGLLPEGWRGYINSAKQVMHAYELLSEEYDWSARREESRETVGAGTIPAINEGEREATIGIQGSVSESVSIEHAWSASLTAGVATEVSAGVKPFGVGADVSLTLSVQATAQTSGNKGRASAVSVTVSAETPVPGRSKKDVTLQVERITCIVPWRQTWKNKTTGRQVVLTSDSRFERAIRAPVHIGKAVPLA